MVEFFILICLVFSIIALVNSSNSTAKLSLKLLEIEKELAKLRDQIRAMADRKSTEKVTTIFEVKPQTSTSTTPTDAFQSVESTTLLRPDDLQALDKTKFSDVADDGEHQIPPTIQPASTATTDGKPQSPFSQKQEYVPPKPRSRGELEALIGGKLLNRIGAVAMIIAVGFFLKYAFDNNWINEWARVSMGAAFGVGMLFLASYFHRKELTVFSQGIVGVGVSSLYLSVYAAYNFYHLMPQLPAFVLMMGVTVIAFLQALKYNSLAAAVMATVGGFLTPLLLPTAQPNEVGLFTYIALLDVGIMILVVAKDRWVLIEHLARFATYLLYFSWFQEYYQQSDITPTLFHLTLFWGLFFAGEFYKLSTQKGMNRTWMTLGSVMNALAFFIGLMMIIDGPYHEHSGWVTLTLSAVYFGAYQALRRQGKSDKILEIHYLLAAITLLIIATGLQFKQYDLVAAWSIQAGILVWCGVRWRLRLVISTGLVLYGLVFFQLLTCKTFPTYDYTAYYYFLFNERSFGMWSYLLSLFGASLVIRKFEDSSFKDIVKYGLTYGWIAVLFAWLTVETNDYFGMYINYNNAVEVWTRSHYYLEMAFGFVWGSYGLLLFVCAWWRKNTMIIHASIFVSLIAFFGVGINSLMYKPIMDFVLVDNIRAGLLLYTIMIFAVQLTILRKYPGTQRVIVQAFGVGILLLIFELITVETFSYYEYKIIAFRNLTGANYYDSNYMIALNNTRQLMLSVVWLVYSILMMVIGFWRKNRGLRIASIALSGIVILKVFVFDLHFLTVLNRIISFFGLGVILLLTSYIYQRYKHILLTDEPSSGV